MASTPHGLPGPIPEQADPVEPVSESHNGSMGRSLLPGASEPRPEGREAWPALSGAPEAAPAATPGSPASDSATSAPATLPGATPDAAPGATPDAAPGATPDAAPGATPDAAPGATPGSSPVAPIYGLSLTDEEIQALDPRAPDERIVVLPWFDELTEAEQEIALVTAFRGLAARGLAAGPSQQEVDAELAAAGAAGNETGTVQIQVDTKIEQVLAMRRAPRRVVVAERTTSEGADSAYFYDVADDLGLIELVQPKGLHTFSVVPGGGLTPALLDYVALPEWAGGEGAPLEIPAAAAAAGDVEADVVGQLAAVRIQSRFVVRSPEENLDELPMFAVHTGPEALLVSTLRPGAGEDVRFDRLTREQLADWITERAGWGSGSSEGPDLA